MVAEEARRVVLPGFATLEEARSLVVEMVEDDDDLSVTAARASAIVDQVWSRRVAEQRSWVGLSDSDRLDAAFGELQADGVVARMCFTCCQSCGSAEIWDEVPSGVPARGYVFFHEQDAAGLAEPAATLFLSYGSFWDEDDVPEDFESAMVEIGRVVQRTLVANGLRVDWDGTAGKRIGLVDLDWRRPLPA